MLFDGLVAHRELFLDLAIAKSLGDESHHFALAIAEAIGVLVFCLGPLAHETVHDPVEDGWTDVALVFGHRVQGVEQFRPSIGLEKIAVHAGAQSRLAGRIITLKCQDQDGYIRPAVAGGSHGLEAAYGSRPEIGDYHVRGGRQGYGGDGRTCGYYTGNGEPLLQVDHGAQAVAKQTFFVDQQYLQFATHRLHVTPERPLYSVK